MLPLDNYRCLRCGHTQCIVGQDDALDGADTPIARIICARCRSTEFFAAQLDELPALFRLINETARPDSEQNGKRLLEEGVAAEHPDKAACRDAAAAPGPLQESAADAARLFLDEKMSQLKQLWAKYEPAGWPGTSITEMIGQFEQLWARFPDKFVWDLHNSLRHLYRDERLSMQQADIILRHSLMDSYILDILAAWKAADDPQLAAIVLGERAEKYADLKFLVAGCLVKAGDLQARQGMKELAYASYAKVAQNPDEALRPYRTLARMRIDRLAEPEGRESFEASGDVSTTEGTRLVREAAYQEMGSAYQCFQVATLDAVMQEHGLSDPAVRQKVCASFLFALGHFHDRGWLKPSADAEPVYPLLCFSKRFLNTDTPIGELGEVYVPSAMFAFHEYAFGNAALLYEGDPKAQVETGNFEGEE